MRAALVLLVASLGGCGTSAPEEGERVACRLHSGRGVDETCRLVWQDTERFTMHHPDGGFRRLAHRSGSILALDGAEIVATQVESEVLRISIGGDSYDLPSRLLERDR